VQNCLNYPKSEHRGAGLRWLDAGRHRSVTVTLKEEPFVRQTWIFQGTPKIFDIDGFFQTQPTEFTWLVSRYADRIAVGDQVFIWRAAGGDGSDASGVIAEAVVADAPALRRDFDFEIPFWTGVEGSKPAIRAVLRAVRTANKREMLKRDWFNDDPVLKTLSILRFASATNFDVTEDEAARINALWLRTGADWTYAESVAGLWAFYKTEGKEISKLPGSPVSEVSLAIGRTVSGIYNKVMNFRFLDPRDARQGFKGKSDMDERVWQRFYNPITKSIKGDELDIEFARLWKSAATGRGGVEDEVRAEESAFEVQTDRLTKLGLEELLRRYARRPIGPMKPNVKTAASRSFERKPLVAALAKVRSQFRCEAPNCPHPVFLDRSGNFYCEVHHIEPLGEGGDDSADNAVCLCAAHHREAHFGKQAGELRAMFLSIRRDELAREALFIS
jgi:hypothetical protein